MGNGKWEMEMENGKGNGKWKMENDKWKMFLSLAPANRRLLPAVCQLPPAFFSSAVAQLGLSFPRRGSFLPVGQ